MKVIKIENDESIGKGCFTIWVWARDGIILGDRPYTFMHENRLIYFLFGGQMSNRRLIGEAGNKDDAIRKATVFLEGWLKECGAID